MRTLDRYRQAHAHSEPVAVVAIGLASDPVVGLAADEAQDRLQRLGPNEVAVPQRVRYLPILGRQFVDPLVLLLVGAAVVSAAIGDALEAVIIAAIVVANAVLGFVQEAGAERAVAVLHRAVAPSAAVVRDGMELRIPARHVVPGDLLVLREGDRVPADARLVSVTALAVDESALTGESVPVDKDVLPADDGAALGDRTSLVFAGTAVTRGAARALVIATGPSTEVGRVARLTAEASHPPTPLQRRLGQVSRVMVAVGLAVTGLLTVAMLLRGATLDEAFLVGVAVAVAAVPEGLAATVTIALAQGARAMAERGAIVRRLAAVETIGAASVIATDKTGTLTQNRLRVAAVVPVGEHDVRGVLRACGLSSEASVDATGAPVGDPVDVALLEAALAEGGDPRVAGDPAEVRATPFDAVRRRSSVAYRGADGWHVVAKGAPEAILAASAHDASGGDLLALAAELARDGLRVLAVGERRAGTPDADDALEIVGLVGLADPLRPAATAAVGDAHGAGIRVLMVTGDHPATASAVGAQLGLGGPALAGPELEGSSAAELAGALDDATIFARVTPEQKLRLVEVLQARGEVVAVTGDGVNDAPALRQADVGVAMGAGGTEAAREAADVVLTDDDFATIVAAVEEGRRIRANIEHVVAFLLSANLGEVALFAVAIVAGLGAPLTVAQILVVNLLTDGLPALALARDPAAPETMRRPPSRGERLVTRALAARLGFVAACVGAVSLAALAAGPAADEAVGRSMAFATLAITELVLVWTLRSPSEPAWRGPRNDLLAAAVGVSVVAVVLGVQVAPVAEALGGASLNGAQWAIVAALAVVPGLAVEVVKARRRRRAAP